MDDDHVQDTAARREELAIFLKSRRARSNPMTSAFGEAAAAAYWGYASKRSLRLRTLGSPGNSLETAAEIGVSEGTLSRIAEALKLDPAERQYVLELARRIPVKAETTISPRVREAIDAIEAPACVMSGEARDWTILYSLRASSRGVLPREPSAPRR